MSKVLFINHSSIGHMNTLLTIALQMKAEGHEVSFLVPGMDKEGEPPFQMLKTAKAVPATIAANGIEVAVLKPPATVIPGTLALPLTRGYGELLLVMEVFSEGIVSYARQILAYLEQTKPDVILTDFAFFAASIASEAAGIPYATIYHSGLPFKGKNTPPFGSGLPIGPDYGQQPNHYTRLGAKVSKRLDRKINAAREEFGLPALPPGILERPYSPWLNLVASVEAIEAPRSTLTPNTLFIGPCFQGRRSTSAPAFPFDKLREDRYKIYVSLGTVFNNKPEIFQKIIAALDSDIFQLVISAGGAYKTLVRQKLPENVLLFQSVPQLEVLPRVDLVIGHGGNNSTNETLAAGKPLLVLPMGGEQHDNARRIEYLQAGFMLNSSEFTGAELYQKVEQIRNDPSFARRTQELQAEIAKTSGPLTASACLDWVARTRHPLTRPEGMPLTINKAFLPELLDCVPA